MGAQLTQLLANYPASVRQSMQQSQLNDAALAREQAELPGIQAQSRTRELAGQLATQQLRDQGLIMHAYRDTDGSQDAMRKYLIQNGISGPGFGQFVTEDIKRRQDLLKLKTEDRDLATKNINQIGNELEGIYTAGDDQTAAALYESRVGNWKRLDPDLGKVLPDKYPGRDAVRTYAGVANHAKSIADLADTQAQTAQRNAVATRDAAQASNYQFDQGRKLRLDAIAALAGSTTRAEYTNRLAELYKSNPQVAHEAFSAVTPDAFDPATSPASLRRLGMTPEEETRADQVATNAAATHAYQNANLGLKREQIGISASREARESGARMKEEDREAVEEIANRIINDTATKGGTLKDAYSNAQKFYQNDPQVRKYRGQVLASIASKQRAESQASPKSGWRDELGAAPATAKPAGAAPAPAAPVSPAASPAASPARKPQEGDEIVNPQTGERRKLGRDKSGKLAWLPK